MLHFVLCTCFLQDELVPFVVRTPDFERQWRWVDDGRPGRPKRGFVATEAGAALWIKINTTHPSGDAKLRQVGQGPALAGLGQPVLPQGLWP